MYVFYSHSGLFPSSYGSIENNKKVIKIRKIQEKRTKKNKKKVKNKKIHKIYKKGKKKSTKIIQIKIYLSITD